MNPSNLISLGRAFLGLSVALTVHSDARTVSRDDYGYSATDEGEPGGPAYQFLFIQDTGLQVVGPGDDISSASPVAEGGIGSSVQLVQPFPFYGEDLSELTPAANGYLSTDPSDLGLDRFNAAALPSPPTLGGGGRIYPLHDDLVISPGGGIYYDYLPASPHPHSAVGGGCHVFQWDNVYLFSSSPDRIFDFEVLLFDNGDIIYQYGLSADPKADAATIGIQNPAGDDGVLYAADDPGVLPPKPPGSQFFPSFAVFLPAPRLVTTAADAIAAPSGSLRDVLARVPGGGTIRFAASLDGVDLRLAGELVVPGGRDIKIIGPEGKTPVLAARGSRLFTVSANSTLTLERLSLSEGRADGAGSPADSGGAILNHGRLYLREVDVLDCHAEGDGGAVCGTAGAGLIIASDTNILRCSAVRSGGGVFSEAANGQLELARVTLDSCAAGQQGGGVCDLHPGGLTTTLQYTTIRGCQAGLRGGGVYSQSSGPYLFYSNLIECVAGQDGGGIYTPGSNLIRLVLAGCRLDRCVAEAGQGGGLFNGGEAFLDGCTIAGNRAGTDGGGLFNVEQVKIRYASIYGNHAMRGGGVFNSGFSQMDISSASIAENTAGADGGGAFNAGNDLRLISTTVAQNHAGSRGGGIRNTGRLFLAGTLVADNRAFLGAPDLFGPIDSRDGANMIGDATGASGLTASDFRDLDAKVGPLGRYGEGNYISALGFLLPNPPGFFTVPLLDGSPAIDSCPDITALSKSVDQRGFPRIADGDGSASATEMDIGAWEGTSPTVVDTTADRVDAGDGVTSLREAIAAVAGSGGRILFNQSVFSSGGIATITLTLGPIPLVDKAVIIDATGVGGVRLDAAGAEGILQASGETDLGVFAIHFEQADLNAVRCLVDDGALTAFRCRFLSNGVDGVPSYVGSSISFQSTGNQPPKAEIRRELRLLECEFRDNGPAAGGAVCADHALVHVRGCTFERNKALYYPHILPGGAICLADCQAEIIRSSFDRNVSKLRGAVSIDGGTVTIAGSTFAGNVAIGDPLKTDYGGGIAATGATLSILNSTLSNNHAVGRGGGVFALGNTPVRISNSILAGNSAAFDPDIISLGGLDVSGNSLIGGDPLLGPLSDYGGGVPTMPPLAGSPAIDGGLATGELPVVDQRGFPRLVGSALDLGAVEAGPLIVVNTKTDERDGSIMDGDISLRDAIDAAIAPGTRIQFDPAVFSGATAAENRIRFDPSLSYIDILDRDLSIDASNLPARVQLNGGGIPIGPFSSGMIHIFEESSLAMHRFEISEAVGIAILNRRSASFTADRCNFTNNSGDLGTGSIAGVVITMGGLSSRATLVDCRFSGNHTSYKGGAILARGVLTCLRCVFLDNEAGDDGGAIWSEYADAASELRECAFVANTSGMDGGAILADGPIRASNTTFSGNLAVGDGGAIFHHDAFLGGVSLHLTHCTLSANEAGGNGGALAGDAPFSLENSVVSGNTAPSGGDVSPQATVTEIGNNFIGGDAKLTPLGDYGGPTPTMFPLPGSPAIDGGSPPSLRNLITDQRGFPRYVAITPDLGAVETETGFINAIDADGDGLPKWWEDLYGLDDNDPSDALGDQDGDGSLTFDEFGNHTSPRDPLDYLRITEVRLLDAINGLKRYRVTWTSWPELQYVIEGSFDLRPESWMDIETVEGAGLTTSHILAQPDPQFFNRIRRE